MLNQPYYTISLRIDGRPERTEQVSEKLYRMMIRLGWFEDGKARLV